MKGVVIVDSPNFCGYVARYDLIVISKCYHSDPELFYYLLEHELEHRRIHRGLGYTGILHHVWHDWKFRFKLMFGEGHKFYTKFLSLSERGNNLMIKEFFTNLIYITLTFPCYIFQVVSMFRILRRGADSQ